MTTVTSRRAPPDRKTLAERARLCGELVGIKHEHRAIFDRVDAIGDSLKQIATEAGDSFREVVDGKGTVSVSPGHDAEFKGDVPQIQTEAWQQLKPAERKALVKSGLVKVEPQWGKKSYGSVRVKLH